MFLNTDKKKKIKEFLMKFMFFKTDKKKLFKETVLYNLKLLVLNVSVVMIWRGTWNLLDRYFFPNDFLVSNWMTIIAWIVIIFLMEYDLETLWVWDE